MLARLSGTRSIRATVFGVLGLLLVTPLVVGALSGSAEAAKPDGTFSVPSGATVTFTNMTIEACNTESGGFQINHTFVETVANNSGVSCLGSVSFPDVSWTNTSGSSVTLTLQLTDSTCGVTYYSDGTSTGGTASVDHATVKRDSVSIADAGAGCTSSNTVDQPSLGAGNFNVTLTFTRH